MSHTTHSRQRSAVSVVLDNRLSYVSFGLAWLVGHGVNALTDRKSTRLNSSHVD